MDRQDGDFGKGRLSTPQDNLRRISGVCAPNPPAALEDSVFPHKLVWSAAIGAAIGIDSQRNDHSGARKIYACGS